jgi:hypothetical protein
MKEKHNVSNQKNSKEDISVSSTIISQLAPRLEDNPDEDIMMTSDINGVSHEEQAAGMITAAAALNDKYGSNLWVSPYMMTNTPESTAEQRGLDPQGLKDELMSPGELEDVPIDDVGKLVDDALAQESDGGEKVVGRLEELRETLDADVVESHGLDAKEEKKEFFKQVLERTKRISNQVLDNHVNAAYVVQPDRSESDLSQDEKKLMAKIMAYIYGDTGCRVGVWDGLVVCVDDVRMYANRHGFDPQEFVEQSWSQKEAEVTLSSE